MNNLRSEFERRVGKPPMGCKWSESDGKYVTKHIMDEKVIKRYNRDYKVFCEGVEAGQSQQAQGEPYGYIYDGQLLCDEQDFIDYFDGAQYDISTMIPVYTAPPAPAAVPEKMTPDRAEQFIIEADDQELLRFSQGWNLCRAMMLDAAPAPAEPVRHSRTRIPEGVSSVRNSATGESSILLSKKEVEWLSSGKRIIISADGITVTIQGPG